jgi:hypothetical protein
MRELKGKRRSRDDERKRRGRGWMRELKDLS